MNSKIAKENKSNIEINDVIQVALDHKLEGALLQVEKVYSWGVEASLYIPGKGKAFINLEHDEYYYIGVSAIIIK